MRRFVNKLSNKIESNISTTNVRPELIPYSRLKNWYEDNGDATLRLDYDLDEHSLGFDLEGYEGKWSAQIFCRYASTVFIFEP